MSKAPRQFARNFQESSQSMSAEGVDFELPSVAPPPFQLFAGSVTPPSDDASDENGASLLPSTNNTGLPDGLKSGVENLSGYSMDDVQVHYNSDKPAQMQAHAYAQGTDIHLGPGQERHLPHEAWHVVQQKQGRVKPTVQLKGEVPVNDNAGLEHEADVMGDRALAHSGSVKEGGQKTASPSGGVVQAKMASDNLVPGHDSYADKGKLKDGADQEVTRPNKYGSGEINVGFTYHHIIPENKLEKFSELLQVEFMAGQTADRRGAYKKTMNPQWFLTHLQDQIGQDGRLLKNKVDDEYSRIEGEKPAFSEAWAASCQNPMTQFLSTLPGIIQGNKEAELGELKNLVKGSIPPAGESEEGDQAYPIFNTLLTGIIDSFTLDAGKHTDSAAIQWNSNNLHRGPATDIRLDAEKAIAKFQERAFSPMELDGGDDFELSAANVIPPDIFNRLNLANELIDKVLELGEALKTTTEGEAINRLQEEMAGIANEILRLLTEVNNRGTATPHQYNPAEWQYQESPEDGKRYASMTNSFGGSPQGAGYDIRQDEVGVRGLSYQEYHTPEGPERDAVSREITIARYKEVIHKIRTDIKSMDKQRTDIGEAREKLNELDGEFAAFNGPAEERMDLPESQRFMQYGENEARRSDLSDLESQQTDILFEGVESDGFFPVEPKSLDELDLGQRARYNELGEQIAALEGNINARADFLIGEANRETFINQYEAFMQWKSEADNTRKAFDAKFSARETRREEYRERIEHLGEKMEKLDEMARGLEETLAKISSDK